MSGQSTTPRGPGEAGCKGFLFPPGIPMRATDTRVTGEGASVKHKTCTDIELSFSTTASAYIRYSLL